MSDLVLEQLKEPGWETLFNLVVSRGYEFQLRYERGVYRLTLNRQEWVRGNLYGARILPEFTGAFPDAIYGDVKSYLEKSR